MLYGEMCYSHKICKNKTKMKNESYCFPIKPFSLFNFLSFSNLQVNKSKYLFQNVSQIEHITFKSVSECMYLFQNIV